MSGGPRKSRIADIPSADAAILSIFGIHQAAPPSQAAADRDNGDNPAIVSVGETYADLGATITGPQSDLNLGIHTFLNGIEV